MLVLHFSKALELEHAGLPWDQCSSVLANCPGLVLISLVPPKLTCRLQVCCTHGFISDMAEMRYEDGDVLTCNEHREQINKMNSGKSVGLDRRFLRELTRDTSQLLYHL